VTAGTLLFGGALTMPIDGGGLTFLNGKTYDFFIGRDSGGGLPMAEIFMPTDFNAPEPPDGGQFSLVRSWDGNSVILRYTPGVPELGSLALLASAAVVGGWRLRRRRISTVGH
jgi:hypothetical protein